MSRGWRVALTVVAAIVAVNVALRLLGSVTGGTPGGPRSSSYATAATGDAAYAELLGRAGHQVDQVRTLPHESPLPTTATVFLLDPPSVAELDALALSSFVMHGGRLVAAGLPRSELKLVLPGRPPDGAGRGVRRASAQGLRGVHVVEGSGVRAWRDAGSAQPLVTAHGRTIAAFATLDRGRVYLLADSSPLQNRFLGTADNAAFGLALAGPRSRPVEFLESYHGYGSGSGLSALPLAWKLLLGGLALAAVVYMVARGRRFGPPEPEGRSLPPPRREYVDSLAAAIARSRRREEAVAPVRREARDRLLRRGGLPPGVDDDTLRATARRLGLSEADVDALLRLARSDDDVLALGRAFVRIGQDQA